MPYKNKRKKANDESINQNPISSEQMFIEKQKAAAAADKPEFKNKPVKFIKRGYFR